ncbi:MAG: hypothetical protein HY293_04230 [Planctomycetes bacterium]|nr:hypothetical protein [Planctomycetota bacterium]
MKLTAGILAFLVLAAYGALRLPSRIHLELYDVQDLTYSMADFGSSAISLAKDKEDRELFTGEDLANRIVALLPGDWNEARGNSIQFQNGVLIVRATSAQQVAIRVILAGYRRLIPGAPIWIQR